MTSDGELGSAFVAVWEERFLYREQPLAQYSLRRMRVMARRFDAEGVPLGVPIVIEERSGFEFGDTQANPVVAMDPHGNFIVVWEPITPYGDGTRLTGRLYDSDGNVIVPRFLVDLPVGFVSCSITGRANPSISVSSDGNYFAVSWTARSCQITGHRDGLRVYRLNPDAALPVAGSNVVLFFDFETYHSTSVFVDADSVDPNSAIGIVLGLESVPGEIRANRFRVDFMQPYPAEIALCGWGAISLLGDGCRRFEFPSIATWPSVISFGTEADWCDRTGIPLHNCVSPVAWTAPRYSCEDEECPSADDRDVLTAPSAEAEPDDCSCGTSNVTVNAFDLDNSLTDEQATGPPHLTYFDQADRGDRRQVASLSHVWLADANTHGAVNAYVWQGVGLIDPTQGTTEENLDPLGVYLTLAADAGTDLPDINANILPEPSADCNGNGTADEIELLCFLLDRNGNDVLDECEIDCDTNETPDVCDIAQGSADCNGDGWPDACDSDCNTNGAADDCDIDLDTSLDCDLNGYPDECDLAPGGCGVDCNTNGTLDACETGLGVVAEADCNSNWTPDACDLAGDDCNTNGTLDFCESVDGDAVDCDSNHLPDVCQIEVEGESDCNQNGTPDFCDPCELFVLGDVNCDGLVDGDDIQPFLNVLYGGGSFLHSESCAADINGDEVINIGDVPGFVFLLLGAPPPIILLDCNTNGTPDANDLFEHTSLDCNSNFIPDECDAAGSTSVDVNTNNLPDECEPDCNGNATPDELDISVGTSADVNTNGVPDECEPDCNTNNTPDSYDVTTAASEDCNSNGVPDECDRDCNSNGTPDYCDVRDLYSNDCNTNLRPDECDDDCNTNGTPDACDLAAQSSPDCNTNRLPDECDLILPFMPSEDANSNGTPDECEEGDSAQGGGESGGSGESQGGESEESDAGGPAPLTDEQRREALSELLTWIRDDDLRSLPRWQQYPLFDKKARELGL